MNKYLKDLSSRVNTVHLKMIVTLGIAIIMSAYLTSPSWNAKLGPIDDHEIVNWLGADAKLNLRELPETIMSTEIGRFGQYPRYRPSYYTMRIIETYLWGDNATLWYATRSVIFVVFSYLLINILTYFVPYLVAVATFLAIINFPYWGDILTRLGPAETYGILGLALYSKGLLILLREKMSRRRLGWVLYLTGYVIAVGTKENFLFLLIPTLLLGVYYIKRRLFGKRALITYLATLGYSLAITLSIVSYTLRTGSDIYGSSISIKERLFVLLFDSKVIINSIISRPEFILILAFVLIAIPSIPNVKKLLPVVAKYVLALGVFGLILASQHLYYGGIFPTEMRYDFPTMLIPALLVLIVAKFFVEIMKLVGLKKYSLAPYLVVLLLFYRNYDVQVFAKIRDRAYDNASRTHIFNSKLLHDREVLSQDESVPVVINSSNAINYEFIVSLRKYYTYLGIKNEIYLNYYIIGDAPRDGLGLILHDRLSNASRYGETQHLKGFQPLDNLSDAETCYAITLGTAEPGRCEPLSSY